MFHADAGCPYCYRDATVVVATHPADHTRALVTLILLLAAADEAELPTYRCVATTQPITIDGKLDDAGWKAAAWTADLVNLRGRNAPEGPAPPRTRAGGRFRGESCR